MKEILTPEHFIEKGYRKFPANLNNADFGLQKIKYSTTGHKAYFLTVWVYDWSKYEQFKDHFKDHFKNRYSFEYEVTLYQSSNNSDGYLHFVVKTTLGINESDDIAFTESWYYYLYNTLNCIPDVHNN